MDKPTLEHDTQQAMHALLWQSSLREALRCIRPLFEQLADNVELSLVLSRADQSFWEEVIGCDDTQLMMPSLSGTDAVPTQALEEANTKLNVVADEEGHCALLLGLWRGERLPKERTFFRLTMPQRPSDMVLQQISALAFLLRPALNTLVRLDATEHQRRALSEENNYFRTRSRRHFEINAVVYRSTAMTALHTQLTEHANDATVVLINGEAGSGKQLIARTLHHLSERSPKMFISQNCGALDAATLDVELFGLGAELRGDQDGRKGLFELAEGGTLYLHEIDRLSPTLQAKLVRVINEREIRRLGESVGRALDVRLLTSSSRELSREVADGNFRRDLYAILQGALVLEVPPLNKRLEDILPLAEHFLSRFRRRYGLEVVGLDDDARAGLLRHAWPGNVRELQVVIEMAVLKAHEGWVTFDDLDLLADSRMQA